MAKRFNSLTLSMIRCQVLLTALGVLGLTYNTRIYAQDAEEIDYSLSNMGSSINSEYDESAPVISPDGKRLFFWSLGRPDGKGYQDIYVSDYDSINRVWKPARNIGPPLNDNNANILLSITPDGQKLLIYRAAQEEGMSDLAIVRRSYDSWGFPRQIKFEGYENTGGSSITAYLAVDGKTMILSTEAKDGAGQEDLYVSFLNPETKLWSKPKNLGAAINTEYSEITPFLSPDGNTLYFSSNRPDGLGGLDVYMSTRVDSTWLTWSKPKNLGTRINTVGDDFHFKFPAKADYAYLVCTHADSAQGVADTSFGKRDIYRIRLPKEARPQPVVLVRGRVLDAKTGKVLPADITYMALPEGTHLGTAHPDPITGEYKIALPVGKEFIVVAEGAGYVAISENFDLPASNAYSEVERDLLLVPMEVNRVFPVNNLFFDTGKASLSQKSLPELMRLVLLMKNHPNLLIEIGTYLDPIEVKDKELCHKRAVSVEDFLIKNGIEADRIFPVCYGTGETPEVGKNAELRKKNRRVEIKIIGL